MKRRDVLLALLLAPFAARASSPEEAKKKDKPKPPPPPVGKPKKGDREAPLSPGDVNLTPDGRNYRAPWKR